MCGSTVIQSRYRRTSYTLDVRMVLQSLVVVLNHDPEYEGNGCPERKVSERVSEDSLQGYEIRFRNHPFLAVIETD
jgi:hypothetical protein